nr:RecName: Full=U-actitoxin-Ael2c; Short=U-AITX-Ael2c; AltName: Full=U-AITX-Ael1a; Flags: Precursor [Anthopleura elegantissima]
SYQRFLFLVVVASLIATSLAIPKDLEKRGTTCYCGNTIGIYWFAKKTCPSGRGYTGSCGYFLGICCYPVD